MGDPDILDLERVHLERDKLRFERQKFAAELRLRRRERAAPKSVWLKDALANPLFLAIVGGIVTLMTGIILTTYTASYTRQAGRDTLQADLIKRFVEGPSADAVRENLQFLVDAGLLPSYADDIRKYLKDNPGAPQVTSQAALGLGLPEEPVVTKKMLIDAQRALGVEPDGNFGPTNSNTRRAIKEFQLGANRRDAANWPISDTTGAWTNRTSLLRFLSPMDKAIFRTPFERAYLGAQTAGDPAKQYSSVDRIQVLAMIALTKVPSASLPAENAANFNEEAVKLLRARLAELRTQRNIEPQKGGDLDSMLFDSLVAAPP